MTSEAILETWEKNRHRWLHQGCPKVFDAHVMPQMPLMPDFNVKLEDVTATMDRITFNLESCGYHHQEQAWEWWNVIHDGRIIAAERYESCHEKYRERNVF